MRSHADNLNQGRDRLFEQLQTTLRKFNTHSDGISDQAKIQIGCRLPLDFDVRAYQHYLTKQLSAEANIQFFAYEPAHRSSRNGPLVSAFSSAVRREFGVAAKYKHKTGTSDLNVVARCWNCPIIAYGPGDSSLDHTPNEHLHLEEYLQSIRVLNSAIENLASRFHPLMASCATRVDPELALKDNIDELPDTESRDRRTISALGPKNRLRGVSC